MVFWLIILCQILNKFKQFFEEIYSVENFEVSQWTRNLNAVFDNTEMAPGKP